MALYWGCLARSDCVQGECHDYALAVGFPGTSEAVYRAKHVLCNNLIRRVFLHEIIKYQVFLHEIIKYQVFPK